MWTKASPEEPTSRIPTRTPKSRRPKREPTEEAIRSFSPATGEALGSIHVTSPEKAKAAIRRARLASGKWAETSFEERAQYLKRANDYINENFDRIAETISSENGKPRVEAVVTDLLPAIYHNRYFAKNAEKLLAPHAISMPLWNMFGKSSYVRHAPYGVVGIISPWNYPFAIPMTQIAMALMAGNTVILKPSSTTAMVGEEIRAVWESTGLPNDVFNVVQGPGRLGETFIEQPVDRLIFTGSVAIGRHLAKLAADKLIPITLELGGKDPAIVLADADLEASASGVLWGAMANAGQTCAGIERVYVQQPLYADFVRLITEKAKNLRVGADRDFDVDMGAISTETQLDIIDRQVKEAVAAGAHVETGGEILEDCCGNFYAPTVLTNVDHSMSIMRDENFGPVLPIMPFDNIDEAVRFANDSPFALSASVWTSDRKKAQTIADQLVAGTITINDSLYSYALAETPWGGFKDSGIGKTHGPDGLREMTRAIHVSYDRVPRMKKPWWYPYNLRLKETFAALTEALTENKGASAWARTLRRLPLRGKL
jgi:succinate-semialdehyde dehydrogenase/glutarate-semialdehyde dehydrogenase